MPEKVGAMVDLNSRSQRSSDVVSLPKIHFVPVEFFNLNQYENSVEDYVKRQEFENWKTDQQNRKEWPVDFFRTRTFSTRKVSR